MSVVAALAAYELPLHSLNNYLPQVEKVTAADIQRFAKQHLRVDDASSIIVGDGRQFLPDLKKRYPTTELIPVYQLDFNKASLIRASDRPKR